MAGILAEAPLGPADATFDPIFRVRWQRHHSDAGSRRSATKTIKSHQHSPNGPLCGALVTTAATSEVPVNNRHPSPEG